MPDRGLGDRRRGSFVKGAAQVELLEENGFTTIRYEVDVAIGGKLAQIGSRVVQGVAVNLAAQFFENIGAQLGHVEAEEVTVAAA